MPATCFHKPDAARHQVQLDQANRRDEGIALDNLGKAYRETGDLRGEGMTVANLGYAYHELRQPDRATASWREAAAVRGAGDHDTAILVEQLATNTRPGATGGSSAGDRLPDHVHCPCG
jgi:hypothetical protein